jgi:small conductance mechanosensitive channel
MKSNFVRAVFIALTLSFCVDATVPSVIAAEDQPTSTPATVKATAKSKQNTEALDQALNKIAAQQKAIKVLQARITKTTGIRQTALEVRLDKTWLNLLEQNLAFANSVTTEEKAGTKVDKYRKQAIEILASQVDVANTVIERIRSRIEFPDPGLSAAEQAAAYTKLYELIDSFLHAHDLLFQSLELSKQFGIDVTKQQSLLKENLAEQAAMGSILLEMAMSNVSALRASVSAVPNDTELKAKLSVATNHVRSLAARLADVLVMMNKLEMDTAAYHEQVLSATGQITTDVFEVSVVTNLLVGWGQSLWDAVIKDGPNLVFKVLLFIVIVFGFRKLADFVQKLIERALEKSHLQLSELLRRMVVSIVRNLIIILGVLIALSQIGISLGPLLAGLGVAGFVIGFALQDSLSNFAAGMMILIYRPFDVGDLIEAGGVTGKVSKMSLVNTTILTVDNQTIVVPNNKIWGDVVRNVTAQTMRRIDMMFGISYTDDIPKTERVLQEILDSHEKVLAEPEPIVRLHELADSSVNFVVRPWVKKEDYWDVYWDITRSVKMRFDEEGISIPFPQRDVHLYTEK